jgi:hypothetical protein
MTGRRSEINKPGVERFIRELQTEFDKHRIYLAVESNAPEFPDLTRGATTIYNGPVIMGDADGAQFAWSNGSVN